MQSFHKAFKKLCKARAFELLDLYYANTHQKRSETELEELAKQLLGNDYLILCNTNKRDAERLLDIYNQLEESDLSSVLFLLLLSNTAGKVKEISFSNSFKHGFDISYPSDLFESRIYYEIQEDTKLFGVDLHGSDCNSNLTKVLSLPPLKYPTLFAEESDCTATGIQDISSIDSAYSSDSNIWDNTFILKPMFKNFISWEKGETEDSPSMSKFITECPMTTFQQLYYNYNLPLSKDVIYIPEALLIKKILLLCGGVQSDIFPFDEKFTCKYSSIITDGTTVKSLGSFTEKYFRFGNNIRSIANFIAVLQDKGNSTSSALAEGIQVFLKIVEHNLIEIETDGGVHLLGLDLLLHPMELLVDFLAKFLNTMSATIESSTNASVYLNLIYQEMLTVEKLREGTKMLSLLKYLYDLASKPLFTWLECWLTQSSNDQIDTFDPHNEFFISGNKQYGYELKEDLLPSFITLELAREIYSMGITWRQVNNNFTDYNSNVFIKWELRSDKIEKYRQEVKFQQHEKTSKLNRYWIELKMKQIQDIEDQYAERVQRLVAKIENYQSLQEERERVNAIVIAKKLDLKSSIEKFLKENEDFKKKELEMQNLQEKEQQNREMEKLENQRLLEHMEIERLNLEYHKKLDNLEKKGMFLDWRTKRVQLSNDRKKILDEPWSEAPLYTFETERKFNYVVQHVEANEIAYPHETTKVVNQNLHTPAPYNGMVSSDCVNLEEQKYSDQEGTNQTLKVTKTQIEDISEKVLEGQSSNSNHESSQLQPDVEMPNESTRIENSFTKDQELINWMLNPCEKNNAIQVVQPNTDIWLKDQFQIVLSISQDFDEMLVSMEESINQTVLFQVQTQLDLLSLLSCSQMFNFEREIDHSDLRFHLNILKQFYLMGDGELVQLLTDRLFKENRSSLNLNGSLSKIPSNQLEFIFQDIIATSTKKIQGNLNIDDLFEIHLNVSATGLELADCIRFTYKPPKPFNTVIDPFLQDYSKVFSFIVPILQASEACNRIKYTLKWKNQSNSIDGESIRTTQLLHKCHWLINSTLFYIFEHGITYPWVDFIKQIDKFVNDEHTSYRFNLKSVVNSHANVLQSIHCNLFLHSEQAPIRHTILELCSTIVDFSKMMQRIQVDKTFTQLEMQFETGLKDLVKLLQIWINRGHEKSTVLIYHEMLATCK